MVSAVATCLLLALALADHVAGFEDCGDTQQDVENGMIRLPDFSGEVIRDLNCSWEYSAPADRQLLVKVDSAHLPPLDLRRSQFQLMVDNVSYDMPRNCVQCLGEMISGSVLKVTFTSSALIESNQNDTSIGSFQIRYKAFDPNRCAKPEQIENGYVTKHGVEIGQSAFYHCHPPYDMIGDPELQCEITPDSPMPMWSQGPPKCTIQDCSGEPVIKNVGPGAIASPGYPTYIYDFSSPCLWEVIAEPNQQINARVTYLKFPKQVDNSFSSSRLTLIDGDFVNGLNLTETLNAVVNFTTSTNKLTIHFVVSEHYKVREETGFYLDYSFSSSSCHKPNDLENGEVILYSTDLGSTASFRCNQGFLLVGEVHSECLQSGQWSSPAPRCEKLKTEIPSFMVSSNDSDVVTATARYPDLPKLRKGNKKKASENRAAKASSNATEVKDMSSANRSKASEVNPAKKSEGGADPKSQPHLLQAIPPKVTDKTSITTEDLITEAPTPNPGPLGLDLSLTTICIAAGVGIPVLLAVIVLIIVLVYRRKYPVRMRFGRKFSTFENPMYVSKDAHHPRELKRLTN